MHRYIFLDSQTMRVHPVGLVQCQQAAAEQLGEHRPGRDWHRSAAWTYTRVILKRYVTSLTTGHK